jgi:hypothetical protein
VAKMQILILNIFKICHRLIKKSSNGSPGSVIVSLRGENSDNIFKVYFQFENVKKNFIRIPKLVEFLCH